MRRTSGRVILICEECGETLVLGEPEEVWLSTRTRFECECGEEVFLASRREKPIQQTERYERQKQCPAPKGMYVGVRDELGSIYQGDTDAQ